MDWKRAIETQRVRLLRHVTGWMALLGFLCVGPLALPLPRWVRGHFDSLTIRAECAAQYLVQASAFVLADGGRDTAALMPPVAFREDGDVPSVQELLRRMNAVCDVLSDLSRRARRMIKALRPAGEALDWSRPLFWPETCARSATIGAAWTPPRIERPPDR